MFDDLLNKRVKVTRKSSKYFYYGELKEVNQFGVIITDRNLGGMFIPHYDVFQIKTVRENVFRGRRP